MRGGRTAAHGRLRRKVLGALLVMVTALTGTVTAAGAGGDHGRGNRHRVEVDLSGTRPPQARECQGEVCVTTTTGSIGTYSGDWTGTSIAGGATARTTAASTTVSAATFTGNVAGCGDGTFTWTHTLVIPLADPSQAASTWRISAGSGTGDLEGIRGGGTVSADPALQTPTELQLHLSGWIRC
jgi:Protein of unknown function (DUF3224)